VWGFVVISGKNSNGVKRPVPGSSKGEKADYQTLFEQLLFFQGKSSILSQNTPFLTQNHDFRDIPAAD
jgi:hypothetical protein